MKILRVFPQKTSMTPIDNLIRFGFQSLSLPEFDEIHISICFTWDIAFGYQLLNYWSQLGKAKIGGPAFPLEEDRFIPGRYIKKGIVITSRGCDFLCPWCVVPGKEGKFRTIKITEGNIIQDNNILLASRKHLQKVFSMLKNEKSIEFQGGLDCRLLQDWHIEELRNLRIKEIWLALDCNENIPYFRLACEKLKKAGFSQNQLRTYVLAGYKEPVKNAETRLRLAWECGTLPFVQLYQDDSGEKRREESKFIRQWSRPIIIKSIMGRKF